MRLLTHNATTPLRRALLQRPKALATSAVRRAFSSEAPPRSDKMGPITWSSLALASVVGAGAVYYYYTEKERLQTQTTSKVVSTGKPLLGGPWTLVDCDTGRGVTDASFRGQFTLLYFGFTHCPDICPNELVRIGDVLDKLSAEDNAPAILPLFVTVDPNRDTIAQMLEYKKDFHPSFKMLTGTRDQVADITKAYRVYFSKADENDDDDDDYLVDHSIVMYLVGPDGEFLDFFTQSARVDDIVKKIKTHLTWFLLSCLFMPRFLSHSTISFGPKAAGIMAKRRNENGQMRRDEWEREQERSDSGGEAKSSGFERASDSTIRQRRIVTARPRTAAKAAATATATTGATGNPFQGFQGLSATTATTAAAAPKPAEKSNPFAGFSGLTGGAATASPKPQASAAVSTKKAPATYQEAMEKLNSEFLAFAQTHLKQNPASDWTAGIQDYLKYAEDIATKFASSKPVPAKPLGAMAPTPSATVPSFLSAAATPAAKKVESSATAPSTNSGFSFSKKPEANATTTDAATAPAKTATSSLFGGSKSADAASAEKTIPAFSFGAVPKPSEAASPATKPSSGFSFGAKPSAESSKSEKTAPAFSFGAAPKSSEASTNGEKPSSGFSFGAKPSTTASAEKPTPAFSFGAAPSSSSKTTDASDDGNSAPAKPAFSFGSSASTASSSSGFSFNMQKPATTSSTATSGFSFNLPASKPSSAAAPSFSFGAAAPAASTAATSGDAAAAADEDEENIGREEATVILKSDNPDEEAVFEVEKAKIFEFKKDEKRWADKGTHPLKVLVNKTNQNARVLVRNEIGKIVINSLLYKGLTLKPHETKGKKTGVTISLQVDATMTQFLLKVNSEKVDAFIKALEDATPN
ncbi:hypothetical protein P43SY_007860 [Pythium insidiosum]|uniref:RanBD1 domain-containing protein n=1 Tax=Pythium insidiosum TaxID=114742 RepID=A0AAD5Q7U1_PYTIN|nr:hypothetical protein P43SY_007860 [Pythium insidiosum]